MDKFEAKSVITRKAMSSALKKLMVKKPLHEITVTDITNACGFHRQTFYYHFTTIKDLLRWTFESDVEGFIRKNPATESWRDGLNMMFAFLSKNKKFCLAAYNSLGRDAIINFFGENLNLIITSVIRNLTAEIQIEEKSIDFMTTVTSGALISIVERWLRGEITWSTEEIVQNISYVAEDLAAGAKLRYKQKKQNP